MRYFLICLITFLNCGGSGEDSAEDETEIEEGEISATLSSIQENIFTPTCALAGCHSSTSASADLSLADGESFENLVGVVSTQLLEMNRVTAGDSDNSYVIYKLQGTQDEIGGSGTQMPQDGLPLSDEELQAIIDWIEAGALDN